MAIIQMAMEMGTPKEGTSEWGDIDREIAQIQGMIQAHSSMIDQWSRRQEAMGSSMQQLAVVVKEMRPTVESLKSFSEILRRRPEFPISNSAKEQRMAGG